MRGKGIIVATAVVAVVCCLVVPATAQSAVVPVDFQADAGATETVFKRAKLKLVATCAAGGNTEVQVLTKRPKRKAAIFAASSEADMLGNNTDAPRYLGVDSFHKKTDGFQLLAANPGLASARNSVGQIVVADTKRVIGIEWLAESGGTALGVDCVFGGVAQIAKAGSGTGFVYREDEGADRDTVFSGSAQMRAECGSEAGAPDLDFFSRTIGSAATTYLSSQSDFDLDGVDEAGYSQSEAIADATVQLDVGSVADEHVTGQALINGSNEQSRVLWVATSSGALKRDCVFAGVGMGAFSSDPARITYGKSGNVAPATFHSRAGLELVGSCNTAPDMNVSLRGTPGTAAHFSVISDANLDETALDEYDEDDQVDAGPKMILSGSGDENALARVVFATPDSRYVVADFLADEEGIFGGIECGVAGVSLVAG